MLATYLAIGLGIVSLFILDYLNKDEEARRIGGPSFAPVTFFIMLAIFVAWPIYVLLYVWKQIKELK